VKFSPKLEDYRIREGHYASAPGKPYGVFDMPGPCGERLTIVATDGNDPTAPPEQRAWEHVSVSTKRRIPNWIEMCYVKQLFWEPEECVVQFHPPESRWVDNFSRCLHLWRWKAGNFPAPPDILVGYKELGTLA